MTVLDATLAADIPEGFEAHVPAPPEPRAPAVLNHLQASKQALAALEVEIAERALASIETRPGAKDALAALHGRMTAVAFEIDCHGKAYELALRLDKQAITDWKADIQALPADQIVAGITATACCKLCSDHTGCIISGNACAHPVLAGSLTPSLQGDPAVRRVYRAASEECNQ
jgi:hypothetical protein